MAGRSKDVASAYDARAVTASANALPNGTCRAVYVGTTGDITGITAIGGSVTFKAVPVGILPVQFRVISACPTDLLALY